VEKTHLGNAGDASHDCRVRTLQLMQPVQQPHAHPMQMPAHIVVLEHVERGARGREGHALGCERR